MPLSGELITATAVPPHGSRFLIAERQQGFAAVGTHLNLADFDNLSIAQGKQLQSQPQLKGDDDDDDDDRSAS